MSSKEFLMIGVGLPRTGTTSTKKALELILPGKCYHFNESLNHEEQWTRICDGKMSDEEFKNLFLSNGFVACVDTPLVFSYERLMRLFPGAKIVLNVRDPSSWVRSMEKTLCVNNAYIVSFPMILTKWLNPITKHFAESTAMYWNMKKMKPYEEMIEQTFKGNGEEYFKQHIDKMKESIPKEKLLVFNVKEGWEPLCKFFNVPIPNEPFPNFNDSEIFRNSYQNLHKIGEDLKLFFQICLFIFVVFVSICCYFLMS